VNDLVNLRVLEALSSNLLVVLGVATAATAWVLWTASRLRGSPSGMQRWLSPVPASALLAVTVLFAVVRNTPWGSALAP